MFAIFEIIEPIRLWREICDLIEIDLTRKRLFR